MTRAQVEDYLLYALKPNFEAYRYIIKVLIEDLYPKLTSASDWDSVIQRLNSGEPLQYISGRTNFFGYFFEVTPAVLIPRPETEELVDWVLKEHGNDSLNIFEVGTGSGCIPIVLKKKRPDWNITSCDISTEALAIAQKNAQNLGVEIDFRAMDFINTFPIGQVDVLISNPPYIDQSDPIDTVVIEHEPIEALIPNGADPLVFYRRIAMFMKAQTSSIVAYIEINALLGAETLRIFESEGLAVTLRKDMQGRDRMIRAHKHVKKG